MVWSGQAGIQQNHYQHAGNPPAIRGGIAENPPQQAAGHFRFLFAGTQVTKPATTMKHTGSL
jgi:hypothetical protein